MTTPEPMPDSWLPVTLMVTTLGMILSAAAETVPSSLADTEAGSVLVLTAFLEELLSLAATTAAPPPPPARTPAMTAATTVDRARVGLAAGAAAAYTGSG